MIFKIARNELRNLFYSPVAWFITLVFFITCAVLYTNKLYDQAIFNELLVKSDPTAMKILSLRATLKLYSGPDGILTGIVRNLHLFIPLLTMGLINREINNGSIRLLYSSPIHIRDIVFGKYLGLMTYNLLLLAVVGVFVATGFFAVSDIDYGQLLTASFGFFLMLAAYSAVGLYMSSLTTYQIVAALGTFLILFMLTRIGGLWQQYDFVRDLTWLLSMEGRLQKLMVGLIRSKDLIYYLSIIFIFLGFTVLRMQKILAHRPWYLVAGRHLLVVAIALTVGYIGSRPRFTKYWDTTDTKVHTIPPSIQELIARMDKDSPLEVTLYTNLVDARPRTALGLPANRNGYLEELWDPYLRFKPDILFRYEYYYDHPAFKPGALGKWQIVDEFPGKSLKHIAQEHAKMFKVNFSMFKSPEEMRKQINLDEEGYALVMQLKYKGKTEFVRFGTGKPGPLQIGGALKRLINEGNPDIAYVVGGLERDIYSAGRRDYLVHTTYKDNLEALINTGFRIDTINLLTRDIPRSITTVVLADPGTALPEAALNKLKAYIDEGKNMMILGEPGKQYVLNPLLQELGVEMLPGQLVEPRYTETPEKISGKPVNGYKAIWGENEYKRSVAFNLPVDRTVEFSGIAAFKYTTGKFDAEPVFQTLEDKAWLKAGKLVTDSVAPVLNREEGDSAGVFNVALKLTRNIGNREQRILVWGDADLFSNWRLPEASNLPSMMMSWLHYRAFPIDKGLIPAKDVMKMPAKQAKWLRIVYIYLVPAIILVCAVLLLKRRNRQ
jgi:ABC-2 type transport system permease protein